MKNANSTEQKIITHRDANCTTENEISLIDLVLVLISRKRLLTLIFTSFIALGIAIALITPKKYTFSTSIEIGSQIISGSIQSIDSPGTLLAKLQHSFIPNTLNEYQLSKPENKNKYEIKASVPKGSNLLILQIEGSEAQADQIQILLKSTTQKSILDHSIIFNSMKENLQSRLEQANIELAELGSSSNNLAEKSRLQNGIDNYSTRLATLRNTREITSPIKSLEPSGMSRKMIVIMAGFTGLVIALLAVFITDFITKVREATRR